MATLVMTMFGAGLGFFMAVAVVTCCTVIETIFYLFGYL